jgi:hypothetical protein
MATVVKRKLSESTDGKGILVVATAATGTTIHTAVAGTTPGTFDEVWLWAHNNHTADIVLNIQAGTVATTTNIIVTIPFKSGLVPVMPGFIFQNSAVLRARAATNSLITISGFVNQITD